MFSFLTFHQINFLITQTSLQKNTLESYTFAMNGKINRKQLNTNKSNESQSLMLEQDKR